MSIRARLVLGTLLAVVLLAVLAVMQVDGWIRRRIEQRGSALVGSPVRVEEVELGFAAGRATLRNLSVANPPGFSAPHALVLDGIEVDVDLASVFSDPLVIDAVRVGAPHVFYEVDAAGRSNIDVLRDQVEGRRAAPRPTGSPVPAGPPPTATVGLVAATPPAGPPEQPAGAAEAPRERRLIIHLFALREGQATLDLRATGGPLRTEELPPFELTAIGVREGGASPKEVGRIMLVAVARDVAIAVAASELEKLVGKDIGGPLGDLLKKGGSNAIGQGLGGVLDAVLGKKKNNKKKDGTADQ